MNPKLKVFLSSSQYENEFIIERESLPVIFEKQPLVALFSLWRIEDFSSPDQIQNHYLKNVSDSDLIILLIGKNFRAAVKEEFDEAIRNDKPVFAFIKGNQKTDQDQTNFIGEVREHSTTTNYSSFLDLSKKIESSLLTYYFRGSDKKEVQSWKNERLKHQIPTKEEKVLRLIAGVLTTDVANSTKNNLVETVLIESSFIFNLSVKEHFIIKKAQDILGSNSQPITKELEEGVRRLIAKGIFIKDKDDKLVLNDEEKDILKEKKLMLKQLMKEY